MKGVANPSTSFYDLVLIVMKGSQGRIQYILGIAKAHPVIRDFTLRESADTGRRPVTHTKGSGDVEEDINVCSKEMGSQLHLRVGRGEALGDPAVHRPPAPAPSCTVLAITVFLVQRYTHVPAVLQMFPWPPRAPE